MFFFPNLFPSFSELYSLPLCVVFRVTFNSYLYKKVQGNNPIEDLKLLFTTIGSLFRGNALTAPDAPYSNPVESLKRL